MNRKAESNLDRNLKIGTFALAIIASITGLITWYNNAIYKSDPLKTTRIEQYNDLSRIIGKMINEKNLDSLKVLNHEFINMYNGQMVLLEDTAVSLSMRRFKLEVDDKMNGIENLANPFKYQASGLQVIKACKTHINGIENE